MKASRKAILMEINCDSLATGVGYECKQASLQFQILTFAFECEFEECDI
jgi:hypothetical protein